MIAALVLLPAAIALRGGPDAFGYSFVDSREPDGPAFSWEELGPDATVVAMSDDSEARIALPFTFFLYGAPYSSLSFGDGALAFGPAWAIDNRNACLPANNRAGSDALILPLWDDLDFGDAEAGTVSWAVLGAAPDRRLVLAVEHVPHYGSSAFNSFQVVLEERGGGITFQYAEVEGLDPRAGGAEATVGIQDSSVTSLQFSCDGSEPLLDGLALRFSLGCPDVDGDGVGACAGDCDDTDGAVNPWTPELDDGLDQDCDGLVDEDFVAEGDVVFTEIMPQPLAADDVDGEWAEVRNLSARSVDLTGWTLEDLSGGVAIPGPLVIAPGARALLAASANTEENGHLPAVDAAYGGYAWSLDDERDELTLALAGRTIDRLAYDTPAWALSKGTSLYLDPGYQDAAANDSPLPWCATPQEEAHDYGGHPGDYGSPGAANPAGVCCHDHDGDGWDLCDGDCDDEDARRFPGNPEVQDLIDNDCDGVPDQEWIPEGAVVVTELLDDPAAVPAEDGEWFELANVGHVALNLRGWRVTDSLGEGFVIADDVIVEPGDLVLFAVAGEAALNGGLPAVDYVYDYDSFPLRSFDDDDLILMAGARQMERITWSNVAPWPGAPGRSTYLCPGAWDVVEDDLLESWALTPEEEGYAYGVGDWGTPGADNPADVDEDGDGVGVCGGDCDDLDPDLGPGAVEDCDNGVDDDCDGVVDGEDADCQGETGSTDTEHPGDSGDGAGGCGGCASGGGGFGWCWLAGIATLGLHRWRWNRGARHEGNEPQSHSSRSWRSSPSPSLRIGRASGAGPPTRSSSPPSTSHPSRPLGSASPSSR
ncbi:MAG: lamin tail domain-containing protein [Pseudomonadota bacterium]